MRLIDADALRRTMYHEAMEKDSDDMNENVNYYVITNTGTTFPVSLDGIPELSITSDATREDIQFPMEGGTLTATIDKESAKRLIRIMFPNNWLKMHGFPKRRKVRR